MANNEVCTINLAQKIVTMGLQTISLIGLCLQKRKEYEIRYAIPNYDLIEVFGPRPRSCFYQGLRASGQRIQRYL